MAVTSEAIAEILNVVDDAVLQLEADRKQAQRAQQVVTASQSYANAVTEILDEVPSNVPDPELPPTEFVAWAQQVAQSFQPSPSPELTAQVKKLQSALLWAEDLELGDEVVVQLNTSIARFNGLSKAVVSSGGGNGGGGTSQQAREAARPLTVRIWGPDGQERKGIHSGSQKGSADWGSIRFEIKRKVDGEAIANGVGLDKDDPNVKANWDAFTPQLAGIDKTIVAIDKGELPAGSLDRELVDAFGQRFVLSY